MDTGVRTFERLAGGWSEWMLAMSWQVAVLVGMLLAITVLARKGSARFRYVLWCLVLVKLCLPPTLSFVTGIGNWVPIGSAAPTAGEVASGVARALPGTEAPAGFTGVFAPMEEVGPAFPAEFEGLPSESAKAAGMHVSWSLALFAIWVAGVGAMGALLCAQYVKVRGQLSESRAVADREIRELFEDARRALGIRRRVALVASESLVSPILFGVLRARVIVPASSLTDLSQAQLRAVFLHELAHLRRRDLVVNWVQLALQTMYWFHPLVWLANLCIRREREMIVDDMVLTHLARNAEDYSTSLLAVVKQAAQRRMLAPGYVGIVETRGSLVQRVRRILDTKRKLSLRLGWISAGVLVALALALIPQGDSREAGASAIGSSEVASPEGESTSVAGSERVKQDTYSGSVVDDRGRPVEGAAVAAYVQDKDGTNSWRHKLIGTTTSGPAGEYSLEMPPPLRWYASHALVVATKDGFSVGWNNLWFFWQQEKNSLGTIELGKPAELAGLVTDENGRPVAGAEVSAALSISKEDEHKFLMGFSPLNKLTVKTDDRGHFAFSNIPRDALTQLIASATGRARVVTPARAANGKLQYIAGSQDIRIVMPPEAVIEGRTVEKETGSPVAGVSLVLGPVESNGYEMVTSTSAEDGSFHIDGLKAGRY